jgi:Recombinase zinc beta ribbon domain
LRIPAPELRIVSDEHWNAVQARFSERQVPYARAGRRRQDIESPYLLSGFARCGTCGGSLAVHTRQHGGKASAVLRLHRVLKRGARVCANNLVARMEVLDAEVLATLQDDVCRSAVVEEAIRLALEELSPKQIDETQAKLETERRKVRVECDRLAAAIEQGGPLTTLLQRLQAAQGRLDAIEGQLRQSEARRGSDVDLARIKERLRAKLADWRGLLQRNVAEGRAVLRALLHGPLRFTPVNDGRRRGYAFEGAIALDRLLAGVVDLPTVMASPTGTIRQWPEWSMPLEATMRKRRVAYCLA